MGFHLSFTGEDGVLPFVAAQADLDGVEVLIQLLELQLTLGELVEGDTQQTVLVDLTDVVKANIKLEAFLYEGVAAASCLVMLLQHQNSLPCLGQRGASCQPADTAPDDDDIQVRGHFVEAETCQTNTEWDAISKTETSKCVV